VFAYVRHIDGTGLEELLLTEPRREKKRKGGEPCSYRFLGKTYES
jgi:hypothetical protein